MDRHMSDPAVRSEGTSGGPAGDHDHHLACDKIHCRCSSFNNHCYLRLFVNVGTEPIPASVS